MFTVKHLKRITSQEQRWKIYLPVLLSDDCDTEVAANDNTEDHWMLMLNLIIYIWGNEIKCTFSYMKIHPGQATVCMQIERSN